MAAPPSPKVQAVLCYGARAGGAPGRAGGRSGAAAGAEGRATAGQSEMSRPQERHEARAEGRMADGHTTIGRRPSTELTHNANTLATARVPPRIARAPRPPRSSPSRWPAARPAPRRRARRPSQRSPGV
jgi:hypothetical protein